MSIFKPLRVKEKIKNWYQLHNEAGYWNILINKIIVETI